MPVLRMSLRLTRLNIPWEAKSSRFISIEHERIHEKHAQKAHNFQYNNTVALATDSNGSTYHGACDMGSFKHVMATKQQNNPV